MLLYHPLDLGSDRRRRVQIYLLSALIDRIKQAFNRRFKEAQEKKERELSK